MKVYRQGDIILEEIQKPKYPVCEVSNLYEVKGETGQTHAMVASVLQPVRVRGFDTPLETYVEVGNNGTVMVHPEHPNLAISPGFYKARRVRTYRYEDRTPTWSSD